MKLSYAWSSSLFFKLLVAGKKRLIYNAVNSNIRNRVNRFNGQTKFELPELILSLARMFFFSCFCCCFCFGVLHFRSCYPAWLGHACQSKLEITLATKPQCIQIVPINNSTEYKKECDIHNGLRKTTASTTVGELDGCL